MSYTIGDIRHEFETYCEKFTHEGITFYLHNIETCMCTSCWKTRIYAEDNGFPTPKGMIVTLNLWDKDKHWYQNMGTMWTKEQAANRCLKYMAEGRTP